MQNNQYQSTNYSLGVVSSQNLPPHVLRRVDEESYEIARQMIRQNMIISAAGVVTQSAMNSVANLSALEKNLSDVYPESAPRLKYLVDSHTKNLVGFIQ